MATAIKIDSFGGIQPRLDPTSLGDTQATLAKNCRLHTTKLCPIQQARNVTDFPIRLEGGLNDVAYAKTIAIWTRGDGLRDVIAWPGLVTVAPSSVYSVPHSVEPWLLMQNAVSPPPSSTPWSILSVSR